MAEPLMTTEQVAEYLAVPRATLYRWKLHGEGPRSIRVGKYLRWRRADVDGWLDERASEDGRRRERATT